MGPERMLFFLDEYFMDAPVPQFLSRVSPPKQNDAAALKAFI
jgi:hypothetical protein